MNIEAIKNIVNSPYMADQEMKAEIFRVLAADEDILPNMLALMETERKQKKELLTDMNLQLSKAHIFIAGIRENKSDKIKSFNKAFVMEEIEKFYTKHKDKIGHCFHFIKNK